MSEKNVSWFHCGRCGTLFKSAAGDVEDRLCVSCGRNPSLGIEPPPDGAPTPLAELKPLSQADLPERKKDRNAHSQRRKKPNYFMAKLIVIWMLCVVGIVFGARKLWPTSSKEETPVAGFTDAVDMTRGEDAILLDKAGPAATRTFQGFVTAESPEARNQFVFSPIETASRMTRFYRVNPVISIDVNSLKITGTTVLRIPGQQAIETRWSGNDGRQFDATFLEERGEWRLDWDHFARFSDIPWALFLAGSGENIGEFRLLARERLADERKGSDSISIILYAPKFGVPGEPGFASPEFLIPRDGKNGKILAAAFMLEKEGKPLFGSKLKSLNPEGFIRLRATVQRNEGDTGRNFEIKDIIAPHWYSTSETGLEIPGQSSAN